MAKRSECNDPTCGCHLPTLQDPVQALEFLLGRFRFAGVAHSVAESYADDIEEILKDYKITFVKKSDIVERTPYEKYIALRQDGFSCLNAAHSLWMSHYKEDPKWLGRK